MVVVWYYSVLDRWAGRYVPKRTNLVMKGPGAPTLHHQAVYLRLPCTPGVVRMRITMEHGLECSAVMGQYQAHECLTSRGEGGEGEERRYCTAYAAVTLTAIAAGWANEVESAPCSSAFSADGVPAMTASIVK